MQKVFSISLVHYSSGYRLMGRIINLFEIVNILTYDSIQVIIEVNTEHYRKSLECIDDWVTTNDSEGLDVFHFATGPRRFNTVMYDYANRISFIYSCLDVWNNVSHVSLQKLGKRLLFSRNGRTEGLDLTLCAKHLLIPSFLLQIG